MEKYFLVPKPLCFPHKLCNPFFVLSLRKKNHSDLSLNLKGREKIYINICIHTHTKLDLRPTDLSVDHHPVLSYRRQLLFYYRHLINILLWQALRFGIFN